MSNSGRPHSDEGRINVEIDELFSWLEQQPELEHLREQAASTKCEYKPGLATTAQRITLNDNPEISSQEGGAMRRFLRTIWVPGSSLRGKAFATQDLDGSLETTAKLMSISTLWDFVTTIPIFQFSLANPLGVLAFPGAIALSYIILLASNVAGENATDRRRGHSARASWSLAAFVLLSAARTAFSGVGVDLWIGSKAIATNYARELAAEKLVRDKAELQRLQKGGPDYEKAAASCSELEAQMKALAVNRAANDTQYVSLFVQAYGSNAVTTADRGLTNPQLVGKYGSIDSIPGICRRKDVLLALSLEKARPLEEAIQRKTQALGQLSPLTYLQRQEPDLFAEHFRLSPRGELEWTNGTEAVGQATDQFYSSLLKGQLGLLGFSLLVLSISIILSAAASIMLYLTSRNPKVLASFTEELKQYRDRRLDAYQVAVESRTEPEA